MITNRIPSAHTSPIQQAREVRRTSQSKTDRDPSVSVSPKTHVNNKIQNNHMMALPSSEPPRHVAVPARTDPVTTPAKRKMEDRDTDDDSDRREVRQRQGDVVANGKSVPVTPRQPPASRSNSSGAVGSSGPMSSGGPRASASPTMEKKNPKRKVYSEPPVWAQSFKNHQKLRHANFEFPKRKPTSQPPSLNGRAASFIAEHKSRNTSPEVARPPGNAQQIAPAAQSGPPPAAAIPPPSDSKAEMTAILGPWEPTIANVKPIDELNKAVADFLFLNVINNQDAVEIASLGIAFEIEAKLGTIIDKDTNERVAYMVASECLLQDRGQLAFRSSMTEVRKA